MNLTWIETALNAGGRLEVRSKSRSRRMYHAIMRWPDALPIAGIGLGVEAALDELNTKLLDDATREMQRSGKV